MDDKISGIFTGIAGVHCVVSELSRRGLIALPTIRNCAGIDILVSDGTGKLQATLQVKTSYKKAISWPCDADRHFKDRNFYFVFLRWIQKENKYDIFMEKGARVVKNILEYDEIMKERKYKVYGKWHFYRLPKGEKEQEKLRRNWREFGVRRGK